MTSLGERARIAHEARWLFTVGRDDLDKLEEILSGYRRDKTRTPSGVWKLARAYSGIKNMGKELARKRDIKVPEWQESILVDWHKRQPESPSPYLFRATLLAYQAITILNDPYDRAGYPGGIEAIKKSLEETRQYLLANKAVASKDPFWYQLMLTIMRTQAEPMDALLEVMIEGAERTPDYLDTYFEVAYAVKRRSRDPFKDLEALAQTAVRMSKDALGDELYSRIYWLALREIFDFDSLRAIKWNWDKMIASMETVSARYPNQWNIQNFALFSCMMQDKATTASFIQRVRGRPMPDVWNQLDVYEACRSWAVAEAGPPSGEPEPERRKANIAP